MQVGTNTKPELESKTSWQGIWAGRGKGNGKGKHEAV